MEPRSKTEGVIRVDYNTGMKMGICRDADLIINNHPICESAGWAVVGVTEYIGPEDICSAFQFSLHMILEWLCNKADARSCPLYAGHLAWPYIVN